MRLIYLSSLTLAILTNSLLIFFLGRRKQHSTTLTFFILFITCINLWALPQLLQHLPDIPLNYFEVFSKLSAFGYTMFPLVFLLFAFAFSRKLHILQNYVSLTSVLVPPMIFLFLSWNSNLIDQHGAEALIVNDWGLISRYGPYFPVFFMWLEFTMFLGLALIYHYYLTTPDSVKRKQALLILSAVVVPLSIGSFTDGILPILGYYVFPLAIPLSTIMALIISYTVSHYELFEVTPQDVLSNLQDAVLSINTEKKIVYVNTAAQQLIGLRKSKMLGRPLEHIFKLSREGKKIRLLPSKLKNDESLLLSSAGYCLIRPDKQEVPIALSIQPVLSGMNKVVGATLAFRDITEEQRIEQAKDDFINMASHELKTPLTTIKAYDQLIQKHLQSGKTDSKKIAPLLIKLHKQVNRLEKLAGDLLDFSRLQTGKFELNTEPVNLTEVVTEVVENMRGNSPHSIVIDGEIDQLIDLDQQRIEQVITNFITNAIKYSPDTQPIIVKLSKTKSSIQVAVQDFGAGISSSDQKKLFQKGFRVNTGTSVSGFGIGLYIAAKIIRNHGGTIGVHSKPGKGSTFYFRLPLEG